MQRRNYFTDDEITLCTYAAMYKARDFGGIDRFETLTHRGIGSIKMKVRNIASMLDEAGIPRFSTITPLTGRPPGERGRTTNLEQVARLAKLPRAEFLSRCRRILHGHDAKLNTR